MVIGELKVILSAAIGDFKARMKDAMDTVKLYGMYAKDNLDKASSSFQSGFKKIGDGVHAAKERITGALELMGKAFIALGGTIALISWQGSKYAEDLWRAWVDASGKIAASGADMDKFGSSIVNMATKSKFGLTEVANAARLAANFNLDEAKTLEAVSAAMDYSMGVGDDLTTSINGISRAMMVFKERGLTAKQAADILAKANIDSRVSAEDMELTLRALGPIANKLGWDFKDIVGMLAVFKDNNIEGGRAMMGLASVLNDVMDPTSQLGKEIEKSGVSIKDTSGKVKNIISLLIDLKRAGSDTSMIFNHLSAIIGPGLSNVVEKGTKAFDNYTKEFSKVDGFAKKLASTFEMTLPGAFSFFVARMKDIPTVLSFFMKDSLTAFFTPMQKAIGELAAMIDKSGFARKLDAALTPVFKAIGGWIGNMLKNWTNFIEKLKPEDIEAAIKKIQGFFQELWAILKKAFEGIDFKALIKGLFEALVMITIVIGKFMKFFSEMPAWAKNISILTAGFLALGGASVVAGIMNLVSALLALKAAVGVAAVAGGAAAVGGGAAAGGAAAGGAAAGGLAAAGGVGLAVGGGLLAGFGIAKLIETFGPKIRDAIFRATHTSGKTGGMSFDVGNYMKEPSEMRAAWDAKKGEKMGGIDKAKDAIQEAMKIEQDFATSLDKEFENMGMDTEALNKEIEVTRGSIEDQTKTFMKTFGSTGDKIIELNNQTIDLMVQAENRIKYLQARLDALERRVASIRFSNKNK